MKNKRLHYLFCFLLLISYFLVLTSVTACGRRGDPVQIVPDNEAPVEKNLNKNGG